MILFIDPNNTVNSRDDAWFLTHFGGVTMTIAD
jgi:hypothetical protein